MNNSTLYKCSIIYELFESDIYLFDSKNNSDIYTLSCSEKPTFFNNFISSEIENFLNIINNSNKSNFHYYNSSYFLCFIGISLCERDENQECVIIGPFLEDNFNSADFVSKYSSTLHNLGSLDVAISFYKNLPIFSSNKHDKLISLLNNLFNFPLVMPKINYIKSNVTHSSRNTTKLDIFDNLSYWKKHYEEENLLLKLIEEGDTDKVIELLDAIQLRITSKSNNYSLSQTKQMLTLTNSSFRRQALNSNVPLEIAFITSNKYAYIIDNASNLSECKNLFPKIFTEYIDLIKKYKSNNYSRIVNSAVSVINKHIQDSITLIDIANELHINPDYLSKKFKLETTLNITDYINKRKIELAIELIKINKYSLLEISQTLGYTNYSSFYKWFKKISGISPKEYS